MFFYKLLLILQALLILPDLQVMASSSWNQKSYNIQYVADIPYYISDAETSVGSENDSITGPCTVIPYIVSMTKDYIKQTISTFTSEDDVWSPGFLATVVFDCSPADAQPAEDILRLLLSLGVENICFKECTGSQHLPWGLYWLGDRNLHRVSRLYADDIDAFVISTVPYGKDDFAYRPFGIAIHGEHNPASLSVAVPSRLYYKRSANFPLAGLRVAVKDNTDLQGVRTGGSSRSYTRLYGPSKETAPAVRRLLKLGAIVVGKTKTTQFADTEWATADWVDFHAPFSPRADGYQTPSGSSAGSGAAIAAFDWLDFATGTDGCGSLRSPAAIEGLFSIRPSYGSSSVQGIIPWGKEFDTFGGFARDIKILETISHVLYPSQPAKLSIPKPQKIFYPTEFWPVAEEDQQTIFHDFIARLESYTDTKCVHISLVDTWRDNNPIGTEKSLFEYFNSTLPWTYAKSQYETYKTFQDDHVKKFGYTPYFNPEAQFKMKWLPTITSEMHGQASIQLGVFQEWFEKNFIPASKEGESQALLLIPWTTGKPDYRDIYRDKPDWAGYGWFYYMVAPFAKAPEVILPIGQTPYRSKVTNREEWLPASIGVVGARGSDANLLSLLRDMMETTKLQTTTQAGRTPFPIQSSSDTQHLFVQNV